MSDEPIFELINLKKYFTQRSSILDTLLGRQPDRIQAVDDVSLSIEAGESVGITGESGCGKTTLLKTLMGLHEPTAGEIKFKGRPISEFDKADWKEFRRNVQLIFQDPFNSIDPKFTVEEAVAEPLEVHGIAVGDRVRETLNRVELNPPEKYLDRTPNQLSGGELQRVAIARALILDPDILLADEPVSMLDVSTQAAILGLLSELNEDLDLSIIYISHDLSTVAHICEQIYVMYLGRVVEAGKTRTLIQDPKHPYAKALINAVPIPDPHHGRSRTELEASPRDPINLGDGCRFRDRCPDRMDVCEKTPYFVELEEGHHTACHLYYDHDSYESDGEPDQATLKS